MELTNKDLMVYFGCSENTAKMRKEELKKYFNLPENRKRISDFHLAKYDNLELSEVHTLLLKRNK